MTVSALAGALYFVCWIGHSYDLADVLAAKEERLENRLWTVVTAVEELVALLKDCTPVAGRCSHGQSMGGATKR